MKIEIPWRWMVLSLFLLFEGVILAVFHFQPEKNRATIVFFATIVAGAFALYTYIQGIEERRALNAHALIRRWNSPEMLSMRLVLREITENRLDPDSLKRAAKGEMPQGVDEKRGHLVTILNFYEELAIAALKKTADEDRLYEFFDAIVSQSASKLDDWIRHERRIDNEPEYYCEFVKLAGRWAEKKGN
jgi:hypothetical protein